MGTCYCQGHCHCGNRYGCMSFIFDLFMICITGGIWLLWIFIREMRRR